MEEAEVGVEAVAVAVAFVVVELVDDAAVLGKGITGLGPAAAAARLAQVMGLDGADGADGAESLTAGSACAGTDA